MADQQFNVTDSQIAIFTSAPPMIVRHNISDEELDVLCEASNSTGSQVITTAIGAAIGAGPTAFPGLWSLFTGGAVPAATVVQALIFVGAGVAIGVAWWTTRGQVSRANGLRKKIRGRNPGGSND